MIYKREDIERFKNSVRLNINRITNFLSSSKFDLEVNDGESVRLSLNEDFGVKLEISTRNNYADVLLDKGQINEIKTWIKKIEDVL